MSMYNATVPQLAKMLRNLDGWLDTAAQSASDGGYDVSVLLSSRLAPDQFALTRQVQTACDTAKFTVARLTGQQAPSHPDTETTLSELKARIEATVSWIESVPEDAFEGSKDRDIALPFAKGMATKAGEYLNAFALPNFYFHVTTAYSILRHNGVPVGKRAFLGNMDVFPAA